MGKSTDMQMQIIREALYRASGCDLQHLSKIEAYVIQALRAQKFTEQELQRLLKGLTQEGGFCTQFRELLNQENT